MAFLQHSQGITAIPFNYFKKHVLNGKCEMCQVRTKAMVCTANWFTIKMHNN